MKITETTEDLVTMVRLHLYNRGNPCGPKAIKDHITEKYVAVCPLSERTIARILKNQGLVKQRTGFYAKEAADQNQRKNHYI